MLLGTQYINTPSANASVVPNESQLHNLNTNSPYHASHHYHNCRLMTVLTWLTALRRPGKKLDGAGGRSTIADVQTNITVAVRSMQIRYSEVRSHRDGRLSQPTG